MAFPATTELVAIALLEQISTTIGGVSTSIPQSIMTDSDFSDDGFVVVRNIGTPVGPYVPTKGELVQIDVWFPPANSSGKIPWRKAAVLAESIVRDFESVGNTTVTLPSGYEDARVHTANVVLSPRRLNDVEERLARYSFDIMMFWTRIEA